MSQNVIQFSCGACQAVLTVPIQMAGVTGPCPKCGATVTSPTAAPIAPEFSVPSIPESPPPSAPPPMAQPATPPPQAGWSPPPVAPPSATPHQGWGSPSAAVSEPDFSPPSSLGGFGAKKSPPSDGAQVESLLSPSPPTSAGTSLPARRLPERPGASGSLLRQVTSGSSGILGNPRQGPSGPIDSQNQPAQIPGGVNRPQAESSPDDPMAIFLRGNARTDAQQPTGEGQSSFPTHIKVNLDGEKKKGGKSILALLLLLVLSGLGYAGWYFLEPIKKIALPYFTSNSEAVKPPAPSQGVPPEPAPPVKTETGGGAFNPEDKTPPIAPPTPQVGIPANPSSVTPNVHSMEPPTPSKPPEGIIEVKPALPTGIEEPSTKTSHSRPPATAEVVIKADPQSEAAAKALVSFFAASNQAERLIHTLGAASVGPLMNRYYEKVADGPVQVSEITLLRYDQTPETGGGAHCVFTVSSKLWEFPIPVMLQEEEGKFKVDWLAFVEFRDNLLYKFLSQYQDEPVRFHVGIRRTHYFEDDVPDLGGKDCFEIQPPLPTYVGYVFVPKKSPLANDLITKISWETSKAYVIVELRWRKEGEKKWVELMAVPQLNWYSFQLGSKPAPAQSPKAIPVGKK